MLSLLIALCLGLWLSGTARAHNQGFTAYAVPVPPIQIDGKLDEWPTTKGSYPLKAVLKGYSGYNSAYPDSTDLSAAFRLAYNPEENLLYLGLEVRDDAVLVGTGFSSTDGCEIYLDGSHNRREHQQYLMFPGDGSYGDGDGANPTLSGGDITQTRSRGAWTAADGLITYEWAFAVYEDLPDKPLQLKSGMRFGLDVVALDVDQRDEAAHWLSWSPGGGKHTRAERLGDVVLLSSSAEWEQLGEINGQVLQPSTLKPWREVLVQARNQEGTLVGTDLTDAAGYFALWAPAGSYLLHLPEAAEGDNLSPRETILLESGQTTETILHMLRKKGPTLPRWPFVTVLVLFSAGALFCLAQLRSQWGALGELLLAPQATLKGLASRPEWSLPCWVLLFAVTLASVSSINQLSGTLLGALLNMPGALGTSLMLALPLLSTLLFLVLGFAGWLFAALILWLLARLWDIRGNFFTLVSLVGYALIPKMLGVAAAAALVAWGVQEDLPWSAQGISLGGLLDPEPGLLADLLDQIEFFALWSLALLVLALKAFFGLSAARAAVLVGIYWAIYLSALTSYFALSRSLAQVFAA